MKKIEPIEPDPVLEKYRKMHEKPPVITPAVIEVLRRLAEKRLSDLPGNTGAEKQKLEILASGRIMAGAGVDHEKFRMRQLRYTKIDVEKRATVASLSSKSDIAMCLVGYTDRVYMEDINSYDSVMGIWDMGFYEIVVPVPDILYGKLDRIEFLPVDKVAGDANRHPHHYKGYTCWGMFANTISGSMKGVEIAEMFRQLRIFVGRWYSGSTLTHNWEGFRVAERSFRWQGRKMLCEPFHELAVPVPKVRRERVLSSSEMPF